MSQFQVEPQQLHELLRWWKVPIPWDPVPDWLFERLGPDLMRDLMVANLELERDVLQRQTKALEAKIDILNRGLRK